MDKWSIITVTHNSEGNLRHFWTHELPPHVEWIVVDNASTDHSVDYAESLGASHVVRLPRNVGFAKACNLGLALASGYYTCFANPDVSVDYSTLEQLERHLGDIPSLVGPQLMYESGELQPNGRGLPTLSSKITNRLFKGRSQQYLLYANEHSLINVWWMMGAAVCARTETFRSLHGWDERYFLYYEDCDLGLRAWRANVPVRISGDVRWVHGWARETTKVKWAPWKREIASMCRFYCRYPGLLLGTRLATPFFEKTRRLLYTSVTYGDSDAS